MFTLNYEQAFVVEEAVKWYLNSSEQVFQYDGKPGTGKSVVLNEIIQRLGLNPLTEIASMSYIGSASIVMRMKGLVNAKTIHSWLYDVDEVLMRDENGKPIMDTLLNVPIKKPRFIPVNHLDPSIKLIVIDEGFTVPLKMKHQIEKFGVKVLVCGDQGQLPPINDEPAYLMYGKIYHLNTVMRQTGRDDIVYICSRVSQGLPLLNGFYGNSLVINREDLTDEMLLWADIVICGKNKTRDFYNDHIRALKGYKGLLPQYGEKVVCRKNNWLEKIDFDNGTSINLVNGLIGTVSNNPDVSGFDGKLFTMDFIPDLINATFSGIRCNYLHMISEHTIREKIRNNRYEVGNMFEFGYAISTHVSQGGEWGSTIYIEEYMHPSIQNQLNNVGASRCNQRLIYVKK